MDSCVNVSHQVKHEMKNLLSNDDDEWKRMVSLKSDTMHIGSKYRDEFEWEYLSSLITRLMYIVQMIPH